MHRHRRPEPRAPAAGQAAGVGPADVGPGARGHLRHPGFTGRRRGPGGGRSVLWQRGAWVEALSRGAASSTFVDLDPDTLGAVRLNLAAVGLDEEPATLVRAALPGWLESAAAGSLTSPCATPRTPSTTGRRSSGRCGRTPWSWNRRRRSCCRGPGWSRESAGTAVRSSPWPIAAVTTRESRSLPRVVRPLSQRAPRDRRTGQPALRRGGGGGAAQSPEEHSAVRPRGAPGDVGRGGVAPPDCADHLHVDTAGQHRPRCRRLGDCPRAAGGVRLRGRNADGPDEQPPLGRRDDLHPHQPGVVLRGLQARPRGGPLRR